LNDRFLKQYLLAPVPMTLLCPVAGAEAVYKYVDPKGDVTFSSDPTRAGPSETVVPIEIDPRLSAEAS
jgi:hypothetical protein